MSYTRPEPDAVNFSWEGMLAYERPALGEVEFTWFEDIGSGVFVAVVPAPVPPVTLAALGAYFVPLISGQITDASGNPAARRVRVVKRSNATHEGETTSDPITGAYTFQVSGYGEYQRIVLAEDESDPLRNDLIDRIKVEWPEA